jgi:hypothetical protein
LPCVAAVRTTEAPWYLAWRDSSTGHLTHMHGKLGITVRVQLAGWSRHDSDSRISYARAQMRSQRPAVASQDHAGLSKNHGASVVCQAAAEISM